MRRPGHALVCALAAGAGLLAGPAGAAIFTCVDASGRRITADRPIPECIDRTQTELNDSGTVRRTHGPSPTEAERAAQEAQARREQLEAQRALEERNRQRALTARFPDPQAFERERALALAPLEAVIATANQRLAELDARARQLREQALRAASQPGDAAARALALGEAQRRAQERFISDKVAEREAVQQRFADMRRQLEPLWNPPPPTGR